jgi:putative ABC transport system ATP-binding protein
MPDKEKTLYRGTHIGFVFQKYNLIPMLTTAENISVPLLILGQDRTVALEKAKKLLFDVGIPEKADVSPAELSGGQQQRVAIARALIHDPDILVCDEPTSALDHESGSKVMDLLRSTIDKTGKTLIVVSHDPRIQQYAHRIVKMEDGKIVK